MPYRGTSSRTIDFQDFAPRPGKIDYRGAAAQFESFEQAVARAAQWISHHGIDVINVETIDMPRKAAVDATVRGVRVWFWKRDSETPPR